MNLFNRLLLIIFGAGLIPVVPTAFFLFYYQAVAKNDVQSLHENISRMAAMMVSQKAEELDRRLYNMWPPGVDYVTQSNLKKVLDRNPEFLYLAFTGPGGKELLSGGTPEIKRLMGFVDLSRDTLFYKAAKTGRAQLGGFELVYNLPLCRFVYPLPSGHYALAVINLRDLFTRLARQKMGETGGIYIADSEGRVFSMRGELQPVGREALKSFFAGTGKSSRQLEGAGVSYLGSFEQVLGFDLYALTLQERRDAFKGINRITSLIAFFLLGISTVFYFSALALSRRLVIPVSELIAGAWRVAGRDYKNPVNEDSDVAEMSALLKAFNMMMKEVDRYHGLQIDKMLEEKQKVELLMSLMHDAVLLSDSGCALLYANASARRLLKVKTGEKLPDEPLGRRVSEFAKNGTDGELLEFKNSDGGRIFYRLNMQALSSKAGNSGVFIVLRDMTLEMEMQRVKEDFFSAMAHDLRAPLLSMQGYLRLLEKSCAGTEKSSGYVLGIKDSSKRLFEMLENVLDMARLDSGHLKPEMTVIEMADFVAPVFESFKVLFEAKNIKSSLLNHLGKARLKGDERLLRRVFENLLSNAYKFTPAGGAVELAAAAENGNLAISVSDTGPGVPENMRTEIFEKYRQLGNSKEEKGVGLGLFISKKIVEMHKGRISVFSGVNGGSKFIVELPEHG